MKIAVSRKKLLLLAIVFQVLSVALIALSREWILLTGTNITLQTAPVDPRDIFRGDYVRLAYLFNRIPAQQLPDNIRTSGAHKGRIVYLPLTTANGYNMTAGKLSEQKPQGLFLKGHVAADWPSSYFLRKHEKINNDDMMQTQPLQINYGIETYFVEQGKGKLIEEKRGMRGGRDAFQTPMLVHAKLSGSGEAVIYDYSWSGLAFKTRIKQSPEANAPDDKAGAVMAFSIKNLTDSDITLPLKPGNCSFDLIPDGFDFDPDGKLKKGRDHCKTAKAVMRVIPPAESLTVEFDLNNPAWVFKNKKKMQPLGRLPWSCRLRIIYNENPETRPTQAQIISRAFHARGNID